MEEHKGESPLKQNLHYFVKWVLISSAIGIVVGLIGTLFGKGVSMATQLWNNYHWTLFLMPAAGLIIVFCYRLAHEEKNKGTDMVISSISATEEVTLATAPLIFISTILSHCVSASAGREGAALQLGGSIGNLVGKLLKLDERDKKVAIMCGMSACFAALFGTPLTAGLFSLEVISIGVMYYAALVPCLFSAFIGAGISSRLGLAADHFHVGEIPVFAMEGALLAIAIGILCACVGILMCSVLHKSHHMYQKYFPNPYVRVAAGSVIFIVLTLIFHSRYYNGSGMQLIEMCFHGERVPYYAFLMKIVFTAVALGAGFKGGEIVPALCVGATLGYVVAAVTGVPVGLCSAVGMVSLFVSVTNCPISAMFLAFELCGFEAMPYYAIAIAVSFTMSGYYGLYHSQKFVYSKLRTEFINRKSNG
ncbi:MAG: chloride channel protein [Brotaphodocola sp.]